ncbi:hypothetical protein [Pseudonocardia abyssalis]|uniref:Uncharacterized protein n=1 Tax=Pseudonocardia abyssalis TaxID=2792008 RepID=A0ABS6UNN5_9PSEU|nr:hypothetical protein [Pseudonocardia abyssalis]MBW0117349.1 hypothetical protein [Pseudonocardia abyssalis]MBW0133866.1 hypothetical protein [Pseudonocardia abyssalis]
MREPTPETLRRAARWQPAAPDPLDRLASAATLDMARLGPRFTDVDAGIWVDFTLHAALRDPLCVAVLRAVCDEAMRTLVASTFGTPARADGIHLVRDGRAAHGSRLYCVARIAVTPDDLVAAAAEIRDERDEVVAHASAGYRLC